MTIRQKADQQISANVNGAETDEVDIENCTRISMFVKGDSDTTGRHVVEIMVSPDGAEWEPTGYVVTGTGSIHKDILGRKVKARITTPELSSSKVHISFIASRG